VGCAGDAARISSIDLASPDQGTRSLCATHEIDIKVQGWGTCAGYPSGEFGEGGAHGESVEVDDGRIRVTSAVAVEPVEVLLGARLSPASDLGGIEFAKARQTGAFG